MQQSKTSNDFRVVISLPAWKARMVRQELYKQGIPSKITTHGTGVSWDEVRGGGMSPDIFMPPFPRDVYVPESQLKKTKDILTGLGIEKSELDMPRIRTWQRIWAAVALILILSIFLLLISDF
jgi:hypothetical protein